MEAKSAAAGAINVSSPPAVAPTNADPLGPNSPNSTALAMGPKVALTPGGNAVSAALAPLAPFL
jgi:hypothetical protein